MKSGAELFELFVDKGVTTAEIASMNTADIHRHISELRAEEPDDITMSDAEIADEIQLYALMCETPK